MHQIWAHIIALLAYFFIVNDITLNVAIQHKTLHVARHIKDKQDLTVITNAERIKIELSDSNAIRLIYCGGKLGHISFSYVGRHTENAIRKYYADKMFPVKGFSPKGSFS